MATHFFCTSIPCQEPFIRQDRPDHVHMILSKSVHFVRITDFSLCMYPSTIQAVGKRMLVEVTCELMVLGSKNMAHPHAV